MHKNTTLRVKKETLDKLRLLAKQQDRSLNYIINNIIEKYLDEF